MGSSQKKEKSIKVDIKEIQNFFEQMNLDTPSKRQHYQFNISESKPIKYDMIYTTKSGGPLKDA